MISAVRGWTSSQKHVVTASYLGWTLDAMDFFILVFVLRDIAAEFQTSLVAVSLAASLTLACRPIGAVIFGWLADRYGRQPVLIANIAVYSLLSFSTAFVPDLTSFLIVRALFGVGMGGVWGISASLSMESIKVEARGLVSGFLQSGYSMGYLLAALIFGMFYQSMGWRGMFAVGIVPAATLIAYVFACVPESPSFAQGRTSETPVIDALRNHWKLGVYAIVLMACFNFFSHGTQDFYPTFLQKQHGLEAGTVSRIAVIYNIAAVLGCLLFGALSQIYGRRLTMISAALFAIPCTYIWALSESIVILGLGAFLINFFVQGCWSIIPAHLNELSPQGVRGVFPGTVYQLGNLLASGNLTLQALIAEHYNYGLALSVVALLAALAISVLLYFGPEAHNVEL